MSEADAAAPAETGGEAPKKSKLPWILAGCGCIALPCIGIIAFVVWGGMMAASLFTAPADAARAHITLSQTDPDAAYEATSDTFKSMVELPAFQAYVKDETLLYTATDVSFSQVNISNNIASMDGTVTGPEGSASVHFELFLSGDDPTSADSWTVNALPYLN